MSHDKAHYKSTYTTTTGSFVKFGRVVFEIRERTDKHMDRDMLIAILRPLRGDEVVASRYGACFVTQTGSMFGDTLTLYERAILRRPPTFFLATAP